MLKWYIKRFAAMSAGEVPYRIRQRIQAKYEQYFCKGRKLPKIPVPETHRILDIQADSKWFFLSEIDVFGKTLNYSRGEINWHADIFSGQSFPLIFSKNINIRKNPSLSAKNVWEVNRLQFLPQIAFNYKQTGNPEYLVRFTKIMNSWIDSNPYLIGINWYSNLEINIRLISWFFCWEILDAGELIAKDRQFKKFVTEKWIPIIYLHCKFSYDNPSRYSSANNHLIAEYSGLFIASSKWKFKEAGLWLDYSAKGLEREILLQHSTGINREEAAGYIQFITDLFLLPFVVGEKTNNPFSGKYSGTLKEIFEYIMAIVDVGGNIPTYGDGDDGMVINLNSNGDSNNFLSLLASASVLYRDKRFKLELTKFDLKNHVLFGNGGKKIYESLKVEASDRKSVFYLKEGHHIFRYQKGRKEIYMHFNSAPLGYLSMAAHGHADALSIILNVNGHGIFVDPGTYLYHVSKEWREYFVGTQAHNTICIDDMNQAMHAGDTLWQDHYRCKLISQYKNEYMESVKAEHDGYNKTKHTREVLFDKQESSFSIYDEIEKQSNNDQKCRLLFHLHPGIKVKRLGMNRFSLKHGSGIALSVAMEDFAVCSVIKGQEEPKLGWYSGSFMQKVPTNVLYAEKTINRSFKSRTKITIHEY